MGVVAGFGVLLCRVSDADWEHLRALGLTHLVAISGFHVGVVAGFGV
ncbi:hypothetical protein C7E24_13995, partial [Stenotrophomonas maltophilia]